MNGSFSVLARQLQRVLFCSVVTNVLCEEKLVHVYARLDNVQQS